MPEAHVSLYLFTTWYNYIFLLFFCFCVPINSIQTACRGFQPGQIPTVISCSSGSGGSIFFSKTCKPKKETLIFILVVLFSAPLSDYIDVIIKMCKL